MRNFIAILVFLLLIPSATLAAKHSDSAKHTKQTSVVKKEKTSKKEKKAKPTNKAKPAKKVKKAAPKPQISSSKKNQPEVEIIDLNKMAKNEDATKTTSEVKTTSEIESIPTASSTEPISSEGDKIAQKDTSFFDFSDLLIPVTHEAPLGSKYGIRDHRLHRGVDVQVIMHEPIVAAYPGKVIMSKYNEGGYGHYVLVQHKNGLQTLYGHLSKRSVKVGDYVVPGDIVGLAGNTGRSSGAHLHFEIRYGNVNIDPAIVVDFPHWSLAKGAKHLSKKKIIQAHNKMQSKLKKENTYVVKIGDTLESIAKWFNISVHALCRINKLSKEAPLKVGQKLHGSN